jgi:hypothetical protein
MYVVCGAIAVLVCATVVALKHKPKNQWNLYLNATPGERNTIQWASTKPDNVSTAAEVIEMYEATWGLVCTLWPNAAETLAIHGRHYAFSLGEAVLASITGTANQRERFCTTYALLSTVYYDETLHRALRDGHDAHLNLADVAWGCISDKAPETFESIESTPLSEYIKQRWKLSPWVKQTPTEPFGTRAHLNKHN